MVLSSVKRAAQKFREQLHFIERSAHLFDSGHETESIRLATSLRVIFHNTTRSISLLKQLDLRVNSVLSSPRGRGDIYDYIGYKLDFSSATPIIAQPLYGDQFQAQPIETWWSGDAVFTHDGKRYCRSNIILGAANKDGGAHVDPELDAFYEALSTGGFADALMVVGDLKFPGPPPFPQGVNVMPNNVHLALIRQFAHEVLTTVNFWMSDPSTGLKKLWRYTS